MVQHLFQQNLTVFPDPSLHRTAAFFKSKPRICIAVVWFFLFFKWMNLNKNCPPKKTRTEILSALVCLHEHAIHHAVHWSRVMNDNLPTCDRATDLVQNDLEMLNIFSFSSV